MHRRASLPVTILILLFCLAVGVFCFGFVQQEFSETAQPGSVDRPKELTAPDHLQYFGFTLIDVFWDDPTDDSPVTNYIGEVAPFSNIADMLVVEPTDLIGERLDVFAANEVKAIIHLHFLLFEQVGTDGPSGANFDLRADYRQRWDTFVKINNLAERHDLIQAFYVGEESTWNGISFEQLRAACDYLKATVPNVKVMIVEASAAIDQLQVPESVDWVGFDHYFIADVENNKDFQSELALLKSKRSAPHQRIILVPDAHFIPQVHKQFGIQRDHMDDIARAYFRLASNDQDVVGMLAYFWPGGFDDPTALGTRNMKDVREVYEWIGKTITGK